METNKIINGDCLKLIKDIPDNSIDFILTDPPYFDNFKVNWNAKEQYVNRTREGEPRKISCKEASMRSSFKRVEEINSQITPKDWFPDALRVLKKNKHDSLVGWPKAVVGLFKINWRIQS